MTTISKKKYLEYLSTTEVSMELEGFTHNLKEKESVSGETVSLG